jgi:hypothetical protein
VVGADGLRMVEQRRVLHEGMNARKQIHVERRVAARARRAPPFGCPSRLPQEKMLFLHARPVSHLDAAMPHAQATRKASASTRFQLVRRSFSRSITRHRFQFGIDRGPPTSL